MTLRKPRVYTPDELDRADRAMTRKLHHADEILAKERLRDIQERGISSPSDDATNGRFNLLTVNPKVVQSPKHTIRRAILTVLIVVGMVYFLLWALGFFLLQDINLQG